LTGTRRGHDGGMASASETLHEDGLPPDVIDRHRAIVSVMEELEAVDWYDQRVSATGDDDLAEILGHNRDEEKEHAAMTLEWLRRHDPTLDLVLRTYLFTDKPIVEEEVEAEGPGGIGPAEQARRAGDGSLGIGTLREH